MKKILSGLVGVLAVLTLAPQAHATLIPPLYNLLPGQCEFDIGVGVLCPSAVADDPAAPVGVQAASITEAINDTNATDTFTLLGTFTSTVYREASGTLDFYYQVQVGRASTADLSSLDVSSFANLITGVGTASTLTLPGIGGAGAFNLLMELTRDPGAGDTISEELFGGGVFTPGTTLLTLAVSTTATTYQLGSDSVRGDQGTSEDLSGYEPDGPSSVPEPVSIVLGGSVLLLTVFGIRRRNAIKV